MCKTILIHSHITAYDVELYSLLLFSYYCLRRLINKSCMQFWVHMIAAGCLAFLSAGAKNISR